MTGHWIVFIEFTRTATFIQSFETQQLYSGKENQAFKIVIRSVTADGIEDTNVFETEVLLAGVAPDTVQELTITTAK